MPAMRTVHHKPARSRFDVNITVLHQLCAFEQLFQHLFATLDGSSRTPMRASLKLRYHRPEVLKGWYGSKPYWGLGVTELTLVLKRITQSQQKHKDNLIPETWLALIESRFRKVLANRSITLRSAPRVKGQIGLYRRNHPRACPGPSIASTSGILHEPSISTGGSLDDALYVETTGLEFILFAFPEGVEDVDKLGFNQGLTFNYSHNGTNRVLVGLGMARTLNHSCIESNVAWSFSDTPLCFLPNSALGDIGYMMVPIKQAAPIKPGDEILAFYSEDFAKEICNCQSTLFHPVPRPLEDESDVSTDHQSEFDSDYVPSEVGRPKESKRSKGEPTCPSKSGHSNSGLTPTPFANLSKLVPKSSHAEPMSVHTPSNLKCGESCGVASWLSKSGASAVSKDAGKRHTLPAQPPYSIVEKTAGSGASRSGHSPHDHQRANSASAPKTYPPSVRVEGPTGRLVHVSPRLKSESLQGHHDAGKSGVPIDYRKTASVPPLAREGYKPAAPSGPRISKYERPMSNMAGKMQKKDMWNTMPKMARNDAPQIAESKRNLDTTMPDTMTQSQREDIRKQTAAVTKQREVVAKQEKLVAKHRDLAEDLERRAKRHREALAKDTRRLDQQVRMLEDRTNELKSRKRRYDALLSRSHRPRDQRR